MIASLKNVTLSTPLDNSRVNPAYRTILGLAPNQSSDANLLSVKFYQGVKGPPPEFDNAGDARFSDCDTFARVILNEVQLVYLQAQVLALVDYLNEGVLVVLTTAESPSSPSLRPSLSPPKPPLSTSRHIPPTPPPTQATSSASSSSSSSLFEVESQVFHVIIPQSPEETEHLSLRFGKLAATHHIFSHDRGAETYVKLSDVNFSCSDRRYPGRDCLLLTECPIEVNLHVQLPTPLEEPIAVDVDISDIRLKLSQEQYASIIHAVDGNITYEDTNLREIEDFPDFTAAPATTSVTHAGTTIDMDDRRSIAFSLAMNKMSLTMVSKTNQKPIAVATASQTTVTANLLPREEKIVTKISLHSLEVLDSRQVASSRRQFKKLFTQRSKGNNDVEKDSSLDLFTLEHVNYSASNSAEVLICINAPQITVLPDLIASLVDFVSVDRRVPTVVASSQVVAPAVASSQKVKVKTSGCRLVLVEMSTLDASQQLTQIAVCHGNFELSYEYKVGYLKVRVRARYLFVVFVVLVFVFGLHFRTSFLLLTIGIFYPQGHPS